MPEKNLIVRIRSKKGMSRLQSLTGSSTYNELRKAIGDQTEISNESLKILKGYPPVVLTVKTESTTLSTLGFQDGELLTVEESLDKGQASSVLETTSNKLKGSESKIETEKQTRTLGSSNQTNSISKGTMLRKVVPANNSCLFTSIFYVMENGVFNLDCQKSMREFIARTVRNDPIEFNEAILGKKNEAYCNWIKNPSSWGGCIELMVLSKYYEKEICVGDIRTGRIDRFGEDKNYPTRVFIIYDGIHFDPLYLQLGQDKVQTVFPATDEIVMGQAAALVNEAKKAKLFTDVENFKLRCLVCQAPLAGQKAAQDHAEKTGHINFGEF